MKDYRLELLKPKKNTIKILFVNSKMRLYAT